MDLWPLPIIHAFAGMGPLSGAILLEALQERCWPRLEVLGISDNPALGKKVLEGVVEVIEDRMLTYVEAFYLNKSGMSQQSGERLLRALKEGACPVLDEVGVDSDLGIDWKEGLASLGLEPMMDSSDEEESDEEE